MRLSPRARTLFSLLFNAAASTTLTLSRDTQSTLFLWVKYRDAGGSVHRGLSFTTRDRQLSHRKESRGCRWVAGKCFHWEGKQGFTVLREGYGWPQQSFSPGLFCAAGRSIRRSLGGSGPSPGEEEVRDGRERLVNLSEFP